MKKIAVALIVASQMCVSQARSFNPEETFDARKNEYKTIELTWLVVDNVTAACSAESKKRLGKSFGYAVDGCSFWEGPKCTIITGRSTTVHTIGHELRHCYQFNWH
jgi:hypothetical protein